MPSAVKRASIAGSSKAGSAVVGATGLLTLPGVTVRCPADNGGACAASAVVRTAGAVKARASARRARRLTLGTASFKIKAGSSRKVKIRLTRKGRRALKKLRTVRAIVTVTVSDRTGGKVTKAVTVKLRAPRKRR